MKIRSAIVRSTLALAALAGAAQAQNQLTTVRIASGLVRPTFVTQPPGDTARMFIVEQRGSAGVATRADIRILNLATNAINATPFLSIAPVATGSEQGLLGLAFDPNYATNGRFYVDYTNNTGTTILARYTVSANPDIANATGTTLISQADPFPNHNGGWVAFGPDGYLYVAWGDGGDFCDTAQNAQNLNSLWGKILRLDVSGAAYTSPATNPFFGAIPGRDEIWDYGLRNPWRPAFDRATGELYIADVGQDYMEEVNAEPPLTGGRNYGWPCREGYVCSNTSPSSCNTNAFCLAGCVNSTAAVDPIWAYVQAATSHCSITGGYVYRGCAMPWLRGTYFFADVCSNQIWSFRYTGANITAGQVTTRTAELAVAGFSINSVVSFGEDTKGELYIVDQGGGEVYRIIPRCTANCDGSTTPPILNVQDFSCFLNSFAAGDCWANCDNSTLPPILNILDFSCYLNLFASGGCT